MTLLRLIALFFIFVPNLLQSQTKTGTVTGTITLNNGEPAASAVVMLEDTKLVVAASDAGTFVFSGVPVGSYKLKVRLLGYAQGELLAVRVRTSDTTRVSIALRENAIELSQILVTGARRQAVKDTRPSVTTMTPREAKYLPGAAEDVLRGLQALPGVTSTTDFSSQLVVRGSGPDQNLIMIDGFEVINPYRLYGFLSMFNPETVRDISLQSGGFAAQYGDRLSAVLDVRNREGRTDVPFAAKLNLSLTNMNAIFEGSLPLEGSSYLLSLRRTYYDLILGPVVKKARIVDGDVALPNFRDLQFRASLPIDEANKVIVNSLISRDGVALVSGTERDLADSMNVFDESRNTMIGATWQFNPTANLIMCTQLSWYRNRGTGAFDGTIVDPSQNTGHVSRGDTIGIRFVQFAADYGYTYDKSSLAQRLSWNAGQQTLEAGYGIDVLRTDFTRYFRIGEDLKNLIREKGFIVPTDETESVSVNRYNTYVQDRLAIDDRLFVQPGLRFDFYPFLKTKVYPSLRLNVSYKLDELTTIRAAYGTYYQSPGMEKQNFQTRLTYGKAALAALEAEESEHYILGVDRMVTESWQFKFETYYKSFNNVIVPEKLQGTTWSSQQIGDNVNSVNSWTTPVRVPSDSLTSRPVNDATGDAYGFELMLQKVRSLPTDKLTGWLSYALSTANRDRDGKTTPFLFDQRHAMNIVGNYKFAENWDLGVRFTLRSGRLISEPVGAKPRVVLLKQNGVETPVIQVDLHGNVIMDTDYERDSYSGELNMYHSLDVRVTTYPSWWGLNWSLYLDVENVLNHKNQQTANYVVDDVGTPRKKTVNGIPIFPSLGMSVIF